MELKELQVFTVKIEREKLAKDADTVIRIFALLEGEGIPSECQAVNIDWLAITIREEYRYMIPSVLHRLGLEIAGLNVTIGDNFTLISFEQYTFTSRTIGWIMGSLSLENIEVKMLRQIKGNRKLVIGLDSEDVEGAKEIVIGVCR